MSGPKGPALFSRVIICKIWFFHTNALGRRIRNQIHSNHCCVLSYLFLAGCIFSSVTNSPWLWQPWRRTRQLEIWMIWRENEEKMTSHGVSWRGFAVYGGSFLGTKMYTLYKVKLVSEWFLEAFPSTPITSFDVFFGGWIPYFGNFSGLIGNEDELEWLAFFWAKVMCFECLQIASWRFLSYVIEIRTSSGRRGCPLDMYH